MANTVLKTKLPTLLIEDHHDPTVMQRTCGDRPIGGIAQLSLRLELVLSLLKKSTTSSPCPVFTSRNSRSPAAFHNTLSRVMPGTDVRPFLAHMVSSFWHCSYT